MPVFLGAFLMIFFAEMGDKSQLLAFSLASRYRARTILAGVFIATLVNNGIAVFVGTALGEMLNMDLVTLVSALVFLGFGAWNLLEEKEKPAEVPVKENLGSFVSLVLLFIIAEMGDKTQVASAVYAATYGAPFLTLAGVVAGMLLADALGILLGFKLKSLVSHFAINVISSAVFFVLGGYQLVNSPLVGAGGNLLLVLFYLVIIAIFISRVAAGRRKSHLNR